ncbi:MAG: hypothetical protein K2I96_15570 [Lachnospiraceae bacterium]|nr:hypothetical protein [Lachnospiraceae bacterium]
MRKWSKLFCAGSICALLAALLTGCGSTEKAALESTGNHTGEVSLPEEAALSEETILSEEVSSSTLPEVYQQMLLYIQEGLRGHGIEGTYQVYFGTAGDDSDMAFGSGGSYDCELLLEGEGNLWMERLSYAYDEDSGWYTFDGQYEPVLAGDLVWSENEDSDFVTKMRADSVYVHAVSGEMQLPYPVRYCAESGPVERDERIEMCPHEQRGETDSYDLWTMLYTYEDERLDMYITILYPRISMYAAYDDAEMKSLQDSVNALIRDAFFYSYTYPEVRLSGADDDAEMKKLQASINSRIRESFLYSSGGNVGTFQPQGHMYGSIDRNYIITRMDENYLSMRIYEFNSFRGANHPNEWENGITIDMHTGKVLQFCDVVGEDWDLEAFIDSGAFHCMWFWENDTGEYWMNHFDRRNEWDTNFYLTDKALGLITESSRYYTNIEADFEDLGISGF